MRPLYDSRISGLAPFVLFCYLGQHCTITALRTLSAVACQFSVIFAQNLLICQANSMVQTDNRLFDTRPPSALCGGRSFTIIKPMFFESEMTSKQ